MTLEVPQHIRQRLAAVIDDLMNAFGQKAAKAYLTRIITVESLKFESEAELYGDDSWMKYIIEDCITNASDSSYLTSFLLYEKIKEFFLQITNSQIETNSYYPVSSSQVINSIFSSKETLVIFWKLRRESKKYSCLQNY